MTKSIITAKKILSAALLIILGSGLFAESEEELKKRILSNADLSGESAEEIMAADDGEDKWANSKNTPKRLPSTFPRDVPYTKAGIDFCEAHYGHKIFNEEKRRMYYDASVEEANALPDDYSKYISLARADYYYGLSIMESFDLTSLDKIDLSDTSSTETVNDKAGRCFDKAIEECNAALKIRRGSDAYSTLAQAISMNCTAKNVSYVLSNGLKVRANAKKAVALDYSNGLGQFMVIAQDAYAPWPFCKLRSSRKALIRILNDKYIRIERFDAQMIYAGIGYTFYKQKKWDKAIEWYKKILEIYPMNFTARQMIKKIEDKKYKRK
ncbi:MAG: tetratricopeptide repeat protein [Treponema sp.]|nr:tetratricopeptide repeat protein [Treponema sp.]